MLEKKMKMANLDAVTVKDGFWKNYMELVRCRMIPYEWEALNDRVEGAEPSYGMANFRAAAAGGGTFRGRVFQDSDVYKWLEAVAYSLMWHPDAQMEATADEAIEIIAAAQQPDGYLDTYYILTGIEKRFTNVMDNHELYILGHMTEAAVAYYRATGKRKLLDTAIRYVDCADRNFGREEGKLRGYPGHEVAEMALVELYGVTGEERHLKLAQYFIDERGQKPLFFAEERERFHNEYKWKESYFQDQYYQAGKPVRDQERAEGHAVRAVYLYSGMAEVAAMTEDQELFAACERLWKSIVEKQMYLTGAIGSSEYGEAFTFDYDLPNDTLYAETCASIGLVFFARRMFEITRDGQYTDIMDRCLYNSIISGMSLDGQKFFYVNPLEVQPEASRKDFYKRHVDVQRQKWFACACCPPNIARLLASLGGYMFEQSEDTVFVNLFAAAELRTGVGGHLSTLHLETEYPWDEDIRIRIENEQPTEFTVAVRIPARCENWTASVNGSRCQETPEKGYLYLQRTWRTGDTIGIHLEMPVRCMAANPRVRDDVGKMAVMRGPLVYCLEEADNGDQLQELYLSEDAAFTLKREPEFLGGTVTIATEGWRLSENEWDEHTLYRTYRKPVYKKQTLKFIPYYAWANRSEGEMSVWVRVKQ